MAESPESITVERNEDFEYESSAFSPTSQPIGQELSNPLLLGPVIKNVLQFVSVKDMKNCRLVCYEWNKVSRLALRSRSNISFRKYEDESELDRRPSRYLTELSSRLETADTLPFTNFKIKSISFHPWKMAELTDFFEREQCNVRELSLSSFYVCEDEGKSLESCDISKMISGCALTKPNSRFSTKLCIDSSGNVLVQSAILKYVKEVELKTCSVLLQDAIKMNPVSLTLMNVSFLYGGTRLDSIEIDEILNFTRLKSLTIYSNYYEDRGMEETRIILDVSSNSKLVLESLTLSNVKVKDWSRCRWEVNVLDLFQMKFVDKTQMQVREIIFRGCYIDTASLPISIQKLSIMEMQRCESSASIDLPNLRYLHLRDAPSALRLFKRLVTCTQLVSLHLVSNKNWEKINLVRIPRTVKNLKLTGVQLKSVLAFPHLKLDKLVLDYYHFLDIKKAYSFHVRTITKDLVFTCSATNIGESEFMTWYKNNSLQCGQRLCIGPCEQFRSQLDESPMVNYGNRPVHYYVFVDNLGTAIDEAQFKRMTDVENEK